MIKLYYYKCKRKKWNNYSSDRLPDTDFILRGVLEDKMHEEVNRNPNEVYVMLCRTGYRAILASVK